MKNNNITQSITAVGFTVIVTLYLAHALPLYFYTVALSAILRSQGVALQWIGMLSLLYLLWAGKFLWAPLIERHYLPSVGRRRARLWCLLPVTWHPIATQYSAMPPDYKTTFGTSHLSLIPFYRRHYAVYFDIRSLHILESGSQCAAYAQNDTAAAPQYDANGQIRETDVMTVTAARSAKKISDIAGTVYSIEHQDVVRQISAGRTTADILGQLVSGLAPASATTSANIRAPPAANIQGYTVIDLLTYAPWLGGKVGFGVYNLANRDYKTVFSQQAEATYGKLSSLKAQGRTFALTYRIDY